MRFLVILWSRFELRAGTIASSKLSLSFSQFTTCFNLFLITRDIHKQDFIKNSGQLKIISLNIKEIIFLRN